MNYIVLANGRLNAFYEGEGGVVWRKRGEDGWSAGQVLAAGAADEFSVNLLEGKIVVTTRDKGGNVDKITISGDDVTVSELIKSESAAGARESMYHGGDVNLLYNMPITGERIHMLMSQIVAKDGPWGAVRYLDRIVPMAGGPFRIVPVMGNHYLVFYQVSGFGSRLGYREVYGKEISGFNLVHSFGGRFLDYSFLATPYALHMLYLVKTMMGCALIYRKKGSGSIGPPVTIAEGFNIQNIFIGIEGGELKLMYTQGNTLFQKSEDGPAIKLDSNLDGRVTKAVFLTDGDKFDDSLALYSEVLVNATRPWDIRMPDKIITPQQTETITTERDYNNFFENMSEEIFDIYEQKKP